MFDKITNFWRYFFDSLKEAYNKAVKEPVPTTTQEWRDTININFLDIFVKKLSNLTLREATFDINTTSSQVTRLQELTKDIQRDIYTITEEMLAKGDFWAFPSTDEKGNIYNSYLPQERVRIVNINNDKITELYGILDWFIDGRTNVVYYLIRKHQLDENGNLTISYSVENENGAKTSLPQWDYLNNESYIFQNANHIGVGRYKSPTSSRGLSPVYGVPLNFGCSEIESNIFKDLKLIKTEFKNTETKIFADPRVLRKKKGENDDEWEIPENVYPVSPRAGQNGSYIDIFSPSIRYSEHYTHLLSDLEMYEREVGTSKGILTNNETTSTATATEVKRANADTLSLIERIRAALDEGNKMTLEADAIFLNIRPELWTYTSDWYDPFEDPAEQWNRLVEAKEQGAAETSDLIKWLNPDLSDEEINEKLQRIADEEQSRTNMAVERALMNG